MSKECELKCEPPVKKSKLVNTGVNRIDGYIEKIKNSENGLIAVLLDDIYRAIPLIKVYVGYISNVKNISRTIKLLNDKLPIKNLQHLKRVRGREVLLCTKQAVTPLPIKDFIENNVSELTNVFEYYKEIEVPSLPPQVKKQFEEANKIWSCNFHPNLYLEKLVNNIFFTSDDLETHRKYMEIVFAIAKWYVTVIDDTLATDNDFIEMDSFNTTVIVDPDLDSIVAVSIDNRLKHPIQHSVMLAIDNVARTQNGGAWPIVNNCNILDGIDKRLLQYLKEKFPQNSFGHKQSQKTITSENCKEGPYLCTGYYVYILKEPCIMCAMALVHARAKRIFFCLDNLKEGALKSRTKLHTVTSLNHHFEVFTGFI